MWTVPKWFTIEFHSTHQEEAWHPPARIWFLSVGTWQLWHTSHQTGERNYNRIPIRSSGLFAGLSAHSSEMRGLVAGLLAHSSEMRGLFAGKWVISAQIWILKWGDYLLGSGVSAHSFKMRGLFARLSAHSYEMRGSSAVLSINSSKMRGLFAVLSAHSPNWQNDGYSI